MKKKQQQQKTKKKAFSNEKKSNYYQATVKVGARRFEIFDQIVSIVFVNVKTYVPVILQFSLVFIFYLFIFCCLFY